MHSIVLLVLIDEQAAVQVMMQIATQVSAIAGQTALPDYKQQPLQSNAADKVSKKPAVQAQVRSRLFCIPDAEQTIVHLRKNKLPRGFDQWLSVGDCVKWLWVDREHGFLHCDWCVLHKQTCVWAGSGCEQRTKDKVKEHINFHARHFVTGKVQLDANTLPKLSLDSTAGARTALEGCMKCVYWSASLSRLVVIDVTRFF